MPYRAYGQVKKKAKWEYVDEMDDICTTHPKRELKIVFGRWLNLLSLHG